MKKKHSKKQQKRNQKRGKRAVRKASEPHSEGMASSVTRHAYFTKPHIFKRLLQGIDSLDLSVDVNWGKDWNQLTEKLEAGKAAAENTKGIIWEEDQDCLIFPSGKAPSYRWHLKYPEFELYISRSQSPRRNSPNVYVSLASSSLWINGIDKSIQILKDKLSSLGGVLINSKPSRLDVCVDFAIPEGLHREMIEECRVPSHLKHKSIMDGDDLETFYQGADGSPLILRIYDKGKETLAKGKKMWFYDLWEVSEDESVWRIEYQMRRPVLKQLGIETTDDLMSKLDQIWVYLTEEWFSLRYPDDSNTSRRTIHPLWKSVQECVTKESNFKPLERGKVLRMPESHWYISHIFGCFVGFSAMHNIKDQLEALDMLIDQLKKYMSNIDFTRKIKTKQMQWGIYKSQNLNELKPDSEQDQREAGEP